MRALRTLTGIGLAMVGVAALGVAVTCGLIQSHAGPDGSYSARLSPVRGEGYAITATDVPALLNRHLATRLLRSDEVRITVESATEPVVLWLVPQAQLAQYLAGVRRTELTGVGFSRGRQPVELITVPGSAEPPPLTEQQFWARSPSGRSLRWDRSTDSGTAVLLVRADGQPDFAASLSVTVYPSWLDEAAWIAVFTSAAAFTAAVGVLFRRVRRGELLATERERVLAFADLVAERLVAEGWQGGDGHGWQGGDRHGWQGGNGQPRWRPAEMSGPAGSPVSRRGEELTGELVPAQPARHLAVESLYVDTAT